MILRLMVILSLSIIGVGSVRSQYLYDSHYVMGYWSDVGYKDPILSFAQDSLKVSTEKLAFGFTLEGVTISDEKGQLLFYFNGCAIANKDHQILDNGTGFNPGRVANQDCPINDGYSSGQQSMISLPLNNGKYILLHDRLNIYSDKDSLLLYSDLNYSVVDMSQNQGKGKVVKKNIPVLKDTIVGAGNIAAVKHANGIDWWVIKQDFRYTTNYYKILIKDEDVIEYGRQSIGRFWERDGGSQASFSADGTRYMRFSGKDGLYVMDFDRATGMFSNIRHVPTQQEALASGASFSPNGRFVYIGNGPHLYQVDLDEESLSLDTVAVWDGSFGNNLGQPNWFGAMQTGPDCRIYMVTGYCVPTMHIIMNPDEKGTDCNVKQHALIFETPVCNIPYFPNFRLDTPYPYCNPDIVVVTGTKDVGVGIKSEKSVTIYPNPGTTHLNFTPSVDMKFPIRYELLTIDGSLARTGMLYSIDILQIDTDQLREGMYFLRLVDKAGKIWHGKWVKKVD